MSESDPSVGAADKPAAAPAAGAPAGDAPVSPPSRPTGEDPVPGPTDPPARSEDVDASTDDNDDDRRSDKSARELEAQNQKRTRESQEWGIQNSVDQVIAGVSAVGSQRQVANAIYNFGLRDVDRVYGSALRADRIRSIVDTYVLVPEFDRITEVLRQHGVAYLVGCEGTGRGATARAALSSVLCGTERLRLVTLTSDARLETLLDHGDVLLPDHGHVLELTASESIRVQTLDAIAGLLGHREKGRYLVIVGRPAHKVDPALAPYAVDHSAPDARTVLERHLSRPPGPKTRDTESCQNPDPYDFLDNQEFTEYLGTSPPPSELVALARRIVEVRKDGQPAAAALAMLDSRLRDLAARLLQDTSSTASGAQLRTISLRVAHAVFYNNSYTVVFNAASVLFRELCITTNPDDEPRPEALFDGGVETLLHADMRGRPTAGAYEVVLPDNERPAPAVKAGLGRAMLYVLWHDYDQVRTPLLNWLRHLGGDVREQVRLRAAAAAALLATFNYSEVYRQVLKPWATAGACRRRDTAAWAMEFIAHEPLMTAWMRQEVQDWCLSTNQYLNDTAARTYGTSLGRLFAEEALSNLHFLSRKPAQTRYTAIAWAVTAICWPDNGPGVLAALSEWVQGTERSPNAQAARAVLFLAHQQAPRPDDAWPALLVLAREDEASAKNLQLLWRQALCEAITALRAWELLAGWLVRADGNGELEDVTVHFAGELLSAQELRSRAIFHLRAWRVEFGQLPIWRRLRDEIRERTAL